MAVSAEAIADGDFALGLAGCLLVTARHGWPGPQGREREREPQGAGATVSRPMIVSTVGQRCDGQRPSHEGVAAHVVAARGILPPPNFLNPCSKKGSPFFTVISPGLPVFAIPGVVFKKGDAFLVRFSVDVSQNLQEKDGIMKKSVILNKVPVAILVRVSTGKQETDRQVYELREVAENFGWEVVEVIEETVSGAAVESERIGIESVMELARAQIIRKVLVHEVSRIARRNSTSHLFLEELEKLGVSIYWHAQRIETLLPSGRRNPAASIMFALLAEMARGERETLIDRINSGIADAKRQGVHCGRPVGTTLSREDFLVKHRDVCRQLRAGHSVRNAAKITGKGVSTVQRVQAAMRTG